MEVKDNQTGIPWGHVRWISAKNIIPENVGQIDRVNVTQKKSKSEFLLPDIRASITFSAFVGYGFRGCS